MHVLLAATRRRRALAPSAVVALACAISSTGCEPTTENCLPKQARFAGPLCASQVCVEVAQPETVLSDANDSTASLTCFGCEQPGPTQYRLELAVGAPGTSDWFRRPNSSGTLALREQWNRSFTVNALNAALQSSSIDIRNIQTTSSGQRVLLASYKVDSGDVIAASQSNGRVQLTLRGHLASAAIPDPLASSDCSSYVAGCVCGYGGSDVPVGSEDQIIKVDVPFRVNQP